MLIKLIIGKTERKKTGYGIYKTLMHTYTHTYTYIQKPNWKVNK